MSWIAWAAGLYEGEGSVGTYNRTNGKTSKVYPQTCLSIHMTDREPLELFAKVFPGCRINGPYKRNKPHWKPRYILQMRDRRQVETALLSMWKFLSPRRRAQAAQAMEW